MFCLQNYYKPIGKESKAFLQNFLSGQKVVMNVELNTSAIDREHAQIFARAIYRDIAAYVQTHQNEYQKFLMEEQENARKSKTSHRPNGTRQKTGK
jgi:endonuclease YncB( thermonuclease family)